MTDEMDNWSARRRFDGVRHPVNLASKRLLSACGFVPCDRATLGLAPRGRDAGDLDGFVFTR